MAEYMDREEYVNRIGQLTVSVLLNRFARKEHRTCVTF